MESFQLINLFVFICLLVKINPIIKAGIDLRRNAGSFIRFDASTRNWVKAGNLVPEEEYISVKTGITKTSITIITITVKTKIAIG